MPPGCHRRNENFRRSGVRNGFQHKIVGLVVVSPGIAQAVTLATAKRAVDG
jgi:hypothetical protein